MVAIDIQIQKAQAVDHSRLLVNTSLVYRKSLQSIQNKIEKLNKKVKQFKAKVATKDKIIIWIKN